MRSTLFVLRHQQIPSTFLSCAVFSLFTLLPVYAFAADELSSPIAAETIPQILDALITFARMIITPLTAIAVMVAAFLYITSGGSEEKITQAKRAITWAVIGLVIVISAQFLQDVVIGVTGGGSRPEDFKTFLNDVIQLLGTILMGLSVLYLLYSAFLFMTAQGEPDKITQARRTLTYALVGIGLAIVALSVPGLITNILKTGR